MNNFNNHSLLIPLLSFLVSNPFMVSFSQPSADPDDNPVSGIPCPDVPSVTYEGQTYQTIQIGTQCWMKKNINTGKMIKGISKPENNGIVEKYCYDDNTVNCTNYGGLYTWDEMMAYVSQPGTQGICPPGWHIPTEKEWCTLATYLDPSVKCDAQDYTGTDLGGKLKEKGGQYWDKPNIGATNESGFTALGAGTRTFNGKFSFIQSAATFWSSTVSASADALGWTIYNDGANIYRGNNLKTMGFSVRCIKN